MTTSNQVNVSLAGQTGTGNFVGVNSPILTTPNLGTPSAGTLTNCTGLPGASFVFLSKQVANNSASLVISSGISNAYNLYLLLFTNIFPVNNTDGFRMQVSVNGGSSYITSGYNAGVIYAAYNSTTNNNSSLASGYQILHNLTNSTSNNGACGHMFLYSMQDGNYPSYSGICSGFSPSVTNQATFINAGTPNNHPNVNAIKFFCSTGNISSGYVVLYGIKEST